MHGKHGMQQEDIRYILPWSTWLRLNYWKALFLLCLLFFANAHASESWQVESSRSLEQLLKSNPEILQGLDESVIQDFYRARKYKLLWSVEKGRQNRAYDLLYVLIRAGEEGLEPSDYHVDEIKRYWESTGANESVQLELLLSSALYLYSNHVYAGRFKSSELDADWYIQNKLPDSQRLFADVAGKSDIAQILKELLPKHSGYQLLKDQLHDYRDLANRGGWGRFNWGPTLELGVQHKQVVQLRQRLQMSGDLVDDLFKGDHVYDRWLEKAVVSFQKRHGLKVDGRVGPQTRRYLNITVDEKIKQIRINMERWRWLPRKLRKKYLMVNMTGFELYLIENDSVLLTMPVIIGKSYRSTPTFSGVLSNMEYNPYWTIPKKLVLEDIIPSQKRDPSYMSKRSIRMFNGWENAQEIDPKTINWKELDIERFPYWLRQDPGPENALGRVKFLFSNPYAIYLHGTPDTYLFDRVVRTFSSGCIRVRDPVRLTSYLLNDGSQQMEEEVLANIHLGSNQKLILPMAIPIYLVYWTAWVDQDGRVNFRDDIYGRDTLLNNAFGG